MQGSIKIINSQDDAEAAKLTREQIIEMATISVRYDDAVYPDGYNPNLQEGEDGFVEPIWRFESEIDQTILSRFGVDR